MSTRRGTVVPLYSLSPLSFNQERPAICRAFDFVSSFITNALHLNGQGQNRTADTRIFSPLLYRLSYLA